MDCGSADVFARGRQLRDASCMTEASRISRPVPAFAGPRDPPTGYFTALGAGDGAAARDPLLPMWIKCGQMEKSDLQSTYADEASAFTDSDRLTASPPKPTQRPVEIPALSAEPFGSQRTPLSRGAAAYNPKPRVQAESNIETEFGRGERGKTTVMMRNLPSSYSRARLVDLLVSMGFSAKFDMIYLPIDFKSDCNLGYAFLNFISRNNALLFVKVFHGFSAWPGTGCRKSCAVCWGEVQGLRANVNRYNRSAVANMDIPEEYKPALFKDGLQMPLQHPSSRSRR